MPCAAIDGWLGNLTCFSFHDCLLCQGILNRSIRSQTGMTSHSVAKVKLIIREIGEGASTLKTVHGSSAEKHLNQIGLIVTVNSEGWYNLL